MSFIRSLFSKRLIAGTAALSTGVLAQWYISGQKGLALYNPQPNTILQNIHRNYVNSTHIPIHQQLNDNINTVCDVNGDPLSLPAPPTRLDNINNLSTKSYDLLVVGGGVVGTSVAVEAATRGLSVALIDKGDFASGTSSKSTKLIHGGVRYLEQAVFTLDFSLLELVHEALRERSHMLQAAPHLTRPLPLIIPLSHWWELPYYAAGIMAYDIVALNQPFPRWSYMTPDEMKSKFPHLADDKKDKGALVYWDGQMNDARYTLALAQTAQQLYNVTLCNYLSLDNITCDEHGYINGAVVSSTLPSDNNNEQQQQQQPFTINASYIINASGPYADNIRQLAATASYNAKLHNNEQDKDISSPPVIDPLVVPSAGVHLTIPKEYMPSDTGLLVPKTPDGRVLFLLPWEDHVIAGTTDAASPITDTPLPTIQDVDFILDIVNRYVDKPITHDMVQSTWAGLRPLVRDPTTIGTSKLSRNHVVLSEPSGLISIMGGKFTTNRQMAEDTVSALLDSAHIIESKRNNITNTQSNISSSSSSSCNTILKSQQWSRKSTTYGKPLYGSHLSSHLLGSDGNFPSLSLALSEYSLDNQYAHDLVHRYGHNALLVAQNVYQQCLHPSTIDTTTTTTTTTTTNTSDSIKQCMLDVEIDYNINYEYAQRAEDILFRRHSIGFQDINTVKTLSPHVISRMSHRLGWDTLRCTQEQDRINYLLSRTDLHQFDHSITEH